MKDGLAAIYERYLRFETHSRIGGRLLAGVPVWRLMRMWLFCSHLLPRLVDIGAAHPDLRGGREGTKPPRGTRVRLKALKDRLLYSPSPLSIRRDILFALKPRQMRMSDGREVAQMLDFFITKLNSSSAVLELRKPGETYPPRPDWQRVYHLDGYDGRYRAFVRSRPDVKGEARRFAERMRSELADAFGVELDLDLLTRLVTRHVCMQLFYGPLFRDWLRKLKVRCVVTSVNYSTVNQILCASAHDEGIPVVELQHGTVYPAHPAYNLPERDERYSPDYLFAWGRHWAEQTRNYALRGTLCTGYPALEHLLTHNPPQHRDGPRRIVFISQGTIGAELSRRAVELRRALPAERYAIVYKLHPNETNTWRELYPWLSDSGVEVVTSSQISVYMLFQKASAVVGVYSTAVIESLMWNLKGYVFTDLPGGDTMTPFLQSGVLEGVDSVRGLVGRLESGADGRGVGVDGSRFWQRDSVAAIVTALEEIVRNGLLSETSFK